MHQPRRGRRLLTLTNCSGRADAVARPSSKDARLAMCFITAPLVSGSRERPRLKSDISSNYFYIDERPDGPSGPTWKVMALPAKRVFSQLATLAFTKVPQRRGTWIIWSHDKLQSPTKEQYSVPRGAFSEPLNPPSLCTHLQVAQRLPS